MTPTQQKMEQLLKELKEGDFIFIHTPETDKTDSVDALGTYAGSDPEKINLGVPIRTLIEFTHATVAGTAIRRMNLSDTLGYYVIGEKDELYIGRDKILAAAVKYVSSHIETVYNMLTKKK